MWGEQIAEAVEGFLKKGKIIQKPAFKFRDPRTGQIPEAELNPYKLLRQIRDSGFQAKIIPPFAYYTYPFKNFAFKSSKEILPIIRIYTKRLVRPCYPASLLLSHTFEIMAIKK